MKKALYAVGALVLLPSVAIHSRPWLSTAQLSGIPNQPFRVVSEENVAPTAAMEGSPQRTRISHRKPEAA